MGRGIESRGSLDANVERRNLEGTYGDRTGTQPKKDWWDLIEESRKREAERKLNPYFGLVGFNKDNDPFKRKLSDIRYTATDIGKATINAPTQDKKEAERVESELENERDSSLDELDK